MNTGHLNDEQFSDLLAGELPDAVTAAHLAECDHCRREIEAVRSSVADFNARTLAWAHMAAPRSVETPSRWALRLGGRPAWGLGIAAGVATLLIAMGIQGPLTRSHTDTAAVTAVATAPSTAELAEDNRLLSSIDQELQYNAQPVVPVAELQDAAQHTRLASPATVSN